MVKVPLELIWDENPDDGEDEKEAKKKMKNDIVSKHKIAKTSCNTSWKKLTKKQKDNLYKKYYDTELAKMIIANGGELKKVKK